MRREIQSPRTCSPFYKSPIGESLHLLNTEKLNQDYKGNCYKRLKYAVSSNNSPSVCCLRLYLCWRKDWCTSDSSKEERERFRERFSMTRLTRGSGWGWGNVLHRAAGSWSWRKAAQQLDTKAKGSIRWVQTLTVVFGDEITEDCQLTSSLSLPLLRCSCGTCWG